MILSRWPFLKAPEKLSSKQQAQLDSLLHRFPTLSEHCWLKERLRTLYRCTTRTAGEILFAMNLSRKRLNVSAPRFARRAVVRGR